MLFMSILATLVLLLPGVLTESSLLECLSRRGKEGTWVKNSTYAATDAQYDTPMYGIMGAADRLFRSKEGANYPIATSYEWKDEQCEIELVSREKLCGVLQDLSVNRIWFLGDSMSQEQANSLWMLMRPESDIKSFDFSSLEREVVCDADLKFSIHGIRNDELLETPEPVSMPDQVGNCCDGRCYCYPWKELYAAEDTRTVFVFNTGAHIWTFDRFQDDIVRFLSELEGVVRGDDILFARTMAPGHVHCGRPNLEAFSSFDEYLEDLEKNGKEKKGKPIYNVTNVMQYNAFVEEQVADRNRLSLSEMFMLDVFPMTALRPDGHLTSADYQAEVAGANNCLHYSLPGPLDWWNHLLYTNLKEIANYEGVEN